MRTALLLTAGPLSRPNLFPMGQFNSAVGWGLNGTWAIADGKASVAASSSFMTAALNRQIIIGRTYRVSCDISDCSGGRLRFGMGSTPVYSSYNVSGNGKFTYYVTPTTGGTLVVVGAQGFTGSVDNIVITY